MTRPLKNLRKKIDTIDNRILELLDERAQIVSKVNKVKEKKKITVFSPTREVAILKRLKKLNKGNLKDLDVELIFKEIFSVFRALRATLKTAYLGPEGTFTHTAAIKNFGRKVQYVSCDSIREVFAIVEKGEAEYGVVPVENSIEGVINYTLDMFFESNLKICAEIALDIQHDFLIYHCGRKIKRIYSNPQVFPQCRRWLAKNYPHATLVPVVSTALAAFEAKKDTQGACIGSRILATLYDLKVLRTNIQDAASNRTRFLVIAKGDSPLTGQDKTSMLFSIKDKVGALHDSLYTFKKYGINLTKIESRPSKKKMWEYYFFVDFEGHRTEPTVERSLKALEKVCNFVKILGSYPKGN